MRIGEVALLAGTTSKAVRFYESVGLLPTPPRESNGYRSYATADLERLRLLVGLRSLDLPLDRAGELAVLCAAGHCEQVSTELRELIAQQRIEIGHRVEELAHLDGRLRTLERHLAAGDLPQSVIPKEGVWRWRPAIARADNAAGAARAPAAAHARATDGRWQVVSVRHGGADSREPRVELLWFADCPNHPAARAMLSEVLDELAPGTRIDDIDATDPTVAKRYRFPGSPTIRVDGRDVDASFQDPGDYTPRCRLYWTAEGLRGVPERAWVEAALRARLTTAAE